MEKRNGKPTKVPYQTSGKTAKSNDPETWTTFDQVEAAFSAGGYSGIGFVIAEPMFGVDLDSCVRLDGTITPWAQNILDHCPSYCEVSPSGTGLKIIGLGQLPFAEGDQARVYKSETLETASSKDAEIQMVRSKFFTVTGEVYGGLTEVVECPRASELFCSLFPAAKEPKKECTTSTDERTERLNAALAAMRKVGLPDNENDGSRRLLDYARQAKRFILDNEDAVRAIRSMEVLHPFPVSYTDAEILKRIAAAKVSSGQDFTPRVTEDPAANMTVNGEPANGVAASAAAKPQPKSTQPKLEIIPAAELCSQYKSLREPLIYGLLRRGETINIIAPPKFGKSWLVLALAICVALGREWLGFATTMCNVLLIDNELHAETLADRLWKVCRALGLEAIPANLHIVTLRGQSKSVADIALELGSDFDGKYGLIVLDALYRLLPGKTNENANGDMTQVYNIIDAIARRTGAAVAVIHHSSKGDQSSKDAVDVGAGAGAITRATDSHLTLRQHELDSCAVLELNPRSWPPIAPTTIHFEFPLWSTKLIPPALKQRKTGSDVKQKNNDQETDAAILKHLKGTKGLTKPELRNKTGYGDPRITRALVRLGEAGKVKSKRVRSIKTKKLIDRWICTEICTPICTDKSSDESGEI